MSSSPREAGAAPDDPKKELVRGEEVLAGVIPRGAGGRLSLPLLQRLRPLERAALLLAFGVGLAIAAVTLVVIFDWYLNRPAMPAISRVPPDQAQKAIENFKLLNEVSLDRVTKLFDLIVVKAFLPLFTGILGYIFGSRRDSTEGAKQE